MNSPGSANAPALEDKAFLLLLAAVSLAFAWILWPFSGTVLWGTVIAILLAPLYRRLSTSMRQRHTLAALTTVAIIVVIVILPLALIAASLLLMAVLSLLPAVGAGLVWLPVAIYLLATGAVWQASS